MCIRDSTRIARPSQNGHQLMRLSIAASIERALRYFGLTLSNLLCVNLEAVEEDISQRHQLEMAALFLHSKNSLNSTRVNSISEWQIDVR